MPAILKLDPGTPEKVMILLEDSMDTASLGRD